MGVFHILVVILIVRGISSFGPSSDPYQSVNILLGRAPELQLLFDINIFEMMKYIVNDTPVINVGPCEGIIGSGASEVMRQRLENFLNDINSLVNLTQVESDFTATLSNGKWDTFFNHYCPKVPTLIEITANATILMKSCMPTNQENIQYLYNSMSLSFRFLCYNNGNNTALFLNNGGVECLSSKSDAVTTCTREALRNYTTMEIVPKLASFDLGLRECRDVEKLRNCTVTALQKCQDPEPATALDSLYDFYKSFTHCQSILQSEASISTGDVADGQLINK